MMNDDSRNSTVAKSFLHKWQKSIACEEKPFVTMRRAAVLSRVVGKVTSNWSDVCLWRANASMTVIADNSLGISSYWFRSAFQAWVARHRCCVEVGGEYFEK